MKKIKLITILLATLLLCCFFLIPVSASTVMKINSENTDSLTVLDSMGREVTIKEPVESIAIIDALPQVASTIQAIGGYNKIIAVDDTTSVEKVPSPDGKNITSIGNSENPDLEKLISLKPDLVLVGLYATEEKIKKLEDAGLNVLAVSLFPTVDEGFLPTQENTKILGKIIGKEDKANEFVNWRDQYLNEIKEKASNLSDSDRPLTMYTYKWDNSKIYGSGSKNRFHYLLNFIGAKDINSDVNSDWAEVDLEHLIKSNPSYLIFEEMSHNSGYGMTNSSTMAEDIKSLGALPGLDSVDAVKNNHVYGLPVDLMTGDTWLASIYLAPVIHPELFGDLNPGEIHKEYAEKFLGINFDPATSGIFIYPTNS
jgi:iron complex transport system substrate-binding protein